MNYQVPVNSMRKAFHHFLPRNAQFCCTSDSGYKFNLRCIGSKCTMDFISIKTKLLKVDRFARIDLHDYHDSLAVFVPWHWWHNCVDCQPPIQIWKWKTMWRNHANSKKKIMIFMPALTNIFQRHLHVIFKKPRMWSTQCQSCPSHPASSCQSWIKT